KAPTFAHFSLFSGDDGSKLSKRTGSLSIRELKDDWGIEPLALLSLMARLGTSDPTIPFFNVDDIIADFDFAKLSRNPTRFDADEIKRLNAKILHGLSYEAIKPRLQELGLDDITPDFWQSVQGNLEVLKDVALWWRIAQGQVAP